MYDTLRARLGRPARALLSAATDSLLGSPEGASPVVLIRQLRHGSPVLRLRAVRSLDDQASVDLLVELLADPVPALRRSAATLLGRRQNADTRSLLVDRVDGEPQDEVRLALAGAAARQGWPTGDAWGRFLQRSQRIVPTAYGLRDLSLAVGMGPAVWAARWRLLLDPLGSPLTPAEEVSPAVPAELRAALWARIRRDPADRPAQEALGAQQHAADLPLLLERLLWAGRRERHSLTAALGLHGDPRAIPVLLDILGAMDDDPGHGFTARREAGLALGRMGLPMLSRPLYRALEDEAHDHEGRPGAGLGIQFPVRSTLLYAIGETGAPDAAPVLADYLGNIAGSAFGGFYLPAMDALIRLRRPEALLPLLRGDEVVVANCIGALAGMGALWPVRPFLQDSRPQVAEAARLALAPG